MILPRYEDAFASLNPQELAVLLPALSLPIMQGDRPFTGTMLLEHARQNHISHADIIMSVKDDTSTTAISIVEKLIMRPIDRRTPYEVNVSRLARPPGSHRSNPASSGTRPSAIPDDSVIRLLATSNPKKAGSDSHTRFAYYTDGCTVAEYIARGGRKGDLAWDSDKGFIRVEVAS